MSRCISRAECVLCFFFLHLCGEACQCCSIRHCVVNTTVKQTTVKFLPIDLQSLAMSSWRHSMSSRALWVILACASIIDPHFVSKIQVEGVKKKKNTEAKLGKVVQPQRDLKLRTDNKTTLLFFYVSLQFKSTITQVKLCYSRSGFYLNSFTWFPSFTYP